MEKQISYQDVFLIPQKCIVNSRKECNTSVTLGKYTFDMPIYPSNMKSVVDIDTCKFLANKGWFYTMHRFGIDVIDFILEMNKNNIFTSISIGINEDSYNTLEKIYQHPLSVDYITIDVANAWSEKTHKMINFIKKKFPETFLIVGNVVTGEAVKELEEWGAQAIKIGIAGGCFVAGTKIKTNNGIINIENIKIGNKVCTHKNRYKKVLAVSKRLESDKLIIINNIKCTPNHKFYVVNKKYKNILTDNNTEEYAEWISADKLNKNFYLLKIKEG